MFEKDNSSNRQQKWLLFSAGFTAEFGLVYVLTLEIYVFFLEFSF